jgi:DNA-binding transcriptional LysR family regulator
MALHLLPCIDALLADHPRLRIELGADDRLLDMARDGIDIAVRTGVAGADGLVARPLGDHARSVFAAPAYLERHGTPQHPEDLARHRLIGNSAAPVLNRWRFVVDGAPMEVRAGAVLRTDNSGITLAMALRGLGIARLLDAIAAPLVEDGRLVRLLESFVERAANPIYAVMLPDRQRLPKVRVCVDRLAAWFGAA